jgi:hypothetical protein
VSILFNNIYQIDLLESLYKMATNAHSTFKADTFNILHFMGPSETGFVIPIYQRSYSWKKEKVVDLINDIISGLSLIISNNRFNEFTYIGGIITTNGESQTRLSVHRGTPRLVHSLVDGQQRISTLVLIALALLPELSSFKDSLVNLTLSDEEHENVLEFISSVIRDLEQITLGQSFGCTNKFPKVIRSNEDTWGETDENLTSPLSKLSRELYNCKIQNNGSFSSFSPRGTRNEINHPLSRLKEIKSEITQYLTGNDSEIFGKIPKIHSNIINTPFVYSEIFNERLTSINYLNNESNQGMTFSKRFGLSIFAYYFLHRVALTQVHGDSEYFAFEVFESLNTSGEPLNAYETLKPLVIKELGASYNASQQRVAIDSVDRIHNAINSIDKRQKLVSDSIVLFINTESGDKISKSLSQQSKIIRDLYTNFDDSNCDTNFEKIKYLKLLRNSTEISHLIQSNDFNISGNFCNILSNDSKLCLSLLIDTRHTLALSIINRFYFEYESNINTDDNYLTSEDINSVIKAVTTFSILWRVAWGGTAGIDQIYRNLMTRSYSRRSSLGRHLSVTDLKNELKTIFFNNNGIGQAKIINKDNFINLSSRIPIFIKNKKIAKFLLLAAQHDSAPDPLRDGFLVNGVEGFHLSLNYENYISESNFTLEHIAPQHRGSWHGDLYSDPYTIHTLGNLILMPTVENSILNNRPWDQKKAIFKALCMSIPADREAEISLIVDNLTPSAAEKIRNARYMPTLDALSKVNDWNLETINKRTEQLLTRAYEKLIKWLN